MHVVTVHRFVAMSLVVTTDAVGVAVNVVRDLIVSTANASVYQTVMAKNAATTAVAALVASVMRGLIASKVSVSVRPSVRIKAVGQTVVVAAVASVTKERSVSPLALVKMRRPMTVHLVRRPFR